MKKSILTEDMEYCYLCGREREAVHHIYHDKRHVKDTELKKLCQERFEQDHSREEFMKIVGRNYLD